jgi:hypothetical protein
VHIRRPFQLPQDHRLGRVLSVPPPSLRLGQLPLLLLPPRRDSRRCRHLQPSVDLQEHLVLVLQQLRFNPSAITSSLTSARCKFKNECDSIRLI